MKLLVKFDHPKYISYGGKDTLKITIRSASKFLQPQDPKFESVPDGYSLTLKLPPQGPDLMTEEELELAK